MAELQGNRASYVVQASDIMPVEATFARPQDPPAELGQPLAREKSIVQSIMKADTETIVSEICIEDAYPDGGLRAWLVVLGCFLYACTMFGWGLNWGVLQDYFHTTMFPNTSLSALGIIAGLANFSMNASSFVFGGLGDRYGYKKIIAISCFLTYLCLLASAFATKVSHLFLFQGVFLGLASGMGTPLYFSIPSQWFFKKRGLATGIAVSGSGIGGGIEALIMRQLIVKIGYRNTMLIFSSLHAVIWTIAWFLLKERVPPGVNTSTKPRWLPKKITGSFCSVALAMFIGVFGYLTPYYFSSTYTREIAPWIDSKSLLTTVPLIVMNFSLGLGRITAGRLADVLGPTNMFFFSFFVGGILQMVFWTFTNSYASTVAFSILNGFVGSWFFSLVPVVCARLFGVEGLSTITGFMILVTSPGQFAGTAIAAAVLSSSGNNWTAVSLYSGTMQIMGALCVLYARFHKEKRIFTKI